MENKKLKAVVLAAGKGTRLQTDGSTLPKVMRLANGQPLLAHVLSALDFIAPEDIVLVVGYKKESVLETFSTYPYAVQAEQLGTGHAVMAAFETLGTYDGDILICCGDMPLIKKETYRALAEEHVRAGNDCTILTGTSSEDLPYGRVLRDASGAFIGMVEDKDATPEQKAIRELNSGVYIFRASKLREVLSELRSDNAQGEYYLTDAPVLMQKRGGKIGVCCRELGYEIIGVNTPEQLRQVEALLQK
ncbi:MAG: NTP transferase domain-containing protein [Oscillospiraceae bacterium]|jgi:UDP-N-acetylglucosamine diphosphorylase/glucosamine-1-phosphate N-acetyltransferase